MPDKHARLSASGAYRWMHCPPSANLEAELKEETSSYAEEGTAAHELAEIKLRLFSDPKSRRLKNRIKKARLSEFYNEEMESATDDYVNAVIEKFNEAKTRSSDAMLIIEKKVDLGEWIPGGFGTADAIIISDGLIEVIDLKYGKGVQVSAEDNPQTRLYGVGACYILDYLYEIDDVQMTIIQPRLDSISSEFISLHDLYEWAYGPLQEAAHTAAAGGGEFAAGSWCKFCKARYTCRARAEENLRLAEYEFAKPPMLEPEEIADILGRAAELKAWASDVEKHALYQAENHGVKYPGWKLVEGRSTRKYSDEQAVIGALRDAGYSEEEIYQKKLQGITAMQKMLGKKQMKELLGELIIKPAGKPTLVIESDKRPEISGVESAQKDFEE